MWDNLAAEPTPVIEAPERLQPVPAAHSSTASVSHPSGQVSSGDVLLEAYRLAGGVVDSDTMLALLTPHVAQPLAHLGRWIATGRIVSFDAQGCTQVPLFQFDAEDMSIRPEVTAVLNELAPVLDADERAQWFTLANAWLRQATPLEGVRKDPGAVFEAARADRFVAKGWC